MKKLKNVSATRYKRDVIAPRTSLENLRKQVEREVADVNQMLKSLRRQSKQLTYSAKKLKSNLNVDKLGAWNNKKNIVKLKSNLSKQQLINIDKMLKRFQNSKTSSKKGLKELEDFKRQNLIEQTDNEEFVNSLTKNQVNKLYSAFDDPDYKTITDQIDPSDLFYLMLAAKSENWNLTTFRKELENYMNTSNDKDLRDSIKTIYDKYIIE